MHEYQPVLFIYPSTINHKSTFGGFTIFTAYDTLHIWFRKNPPPSRSNKQERRVTCMRVNPSSIVYVWEKEHTTLWSLISALSVRYKFLQGGDKYTAVPALPPHPSVFLFSCPPTHPGSFMCKADGVNWHANETRTASQQSWRHNTTHAHTH